MKILADNVILDTDSYKFSHYLQYPPGTVKMTSYLESRGGEPGYSIFFGLRYILERYLTQRVTVDMVEEAKALAHAHGVPFNYDGWMFIAQKLKGKLPLRIDAVSEGSIVPAHNILMRLTSTNPLVFWIPGWFEATLQRIWYPTTVASLSHDVKERIKFWLEKTADNLNNLPFKLHDFGNRGVSSHESAALGGAAHLINFLGTDTVPALRLLAHYYDEPMAGFSIPAAEHSTITSWGRENEVDAYRNMLDQFAKPGALVAVVSDSYDIYGACEKLWGGELRQNVIDSGATLIIRPDSGDPVTIVTNAVQILARRFGTTRNSKGYHVLNNVRVIQGDGVNKKSISDILDNVARWGYSADNIAFGMGGALLQKMDRDTQKFAIKCSGIWLKDEDPRGQFVNGGVKFRPVFKDPVTDPGKKSKSGYLDLEYTPGGGYKTVEGTSWQSVLYRAYENGEIDPTYTKNNTFADIRRRASK